MISIRSLSLPILALASTLAGCSAEGGTAPGAETADTARTGVVAQNETTTTERGPVMFRHHGPGGPDALIFAALHAPIDLTAEQRTTIEGLAKGGRPEGRPPFDATRAKELAAAIRANNVASLPKPTFDESKMKEHVAASAASLKTLHDTLTPAQRAKLVDDMASHTRPGDGPHGPHAKVKVVLRDPHGGVPFGEDLDLTPAQKEQLRTRMEANRPNAAKPDMDAMRTDMTAKLDAFKGDSFDATAFVTPSKAFAHPAGDPLADLVSVLTPEQRETLAKRIEQGPPAR